MKTWEVEILIVCILQLHLSVLQQTDTVKLNMLL